MSGGCTACGIFYFTPRMAHPEAGFLSYSSIFPGESPQALLSHTGRGGGAGYHMSLNPPPSLSQLSRSLLWAGNGLALGGSGRCQSLGPFCVLKTSLCTCIENPNKRLLVVFLVLLVLLEAFNLRVSPPFVIDRFLTECLQRKLLKAQQALP